jgi:hypothetical protein
VIKYWNVKERKVTNEMNKNGSEKERRNGEARHNIPLRDKNGE